MKYLVEILLIVLLLRHQSESHPDGATEFCTDVRRMYNRCSHYENGQTNPVIGQRGKAGPKGEKGERGQEGAGIDRVAIEQMVRRHVENATVQLAQKYANAKKKLELHSQELVAIRKELDARSRSDCSKIDFGTSLTANESRKIIDIFVDERILSVSCDIATDEGGWTIIQRRMDGSEDFFRNHDDYVTGFGNVSGEFWLGLDKIYGILRTTDHFKLRIDMEDWNGVKKYAQYSRFDIAGSTEDYTLSVNGYSGNAGDSLRTHNGMKFTTKDRDLDTSSGNCAQTFKGAWWYASCHSSNLNGLYHAGGPHASYADGVNWQTWKGHYYSLKFVEMKIKPVPN